MRNSGVAARSAAFWLGFWAVACGSADGQNGMNADGGVPATPAAQERAANADDTPSEVGETFPIRVAGIEIQVEIADDEAERSKGLMFRESLPENGGMLFVYESARPLGFWMRNTLIPLDIAYIDEQGRIVDIQSMEPGDETTHWSSSDAMYALEMNIGWFEENQVTVGDLVEF
ncbi:MAG: DUF192 domain-containing protein [Acidobacteriota bacterium]|nr:DUF192 domain-containing protein [Acidobacteriota bacterium]